MKIALFFDCCDIATFYTKYLLKKEIENLGFQCDLIITPYPGQYCFSKSYFLQSDFYFEEVKFLIPSPEDYDCLIIGARHNKSFIQERIKAITNFQRKGKKVIIFQDSTNLDISSHLVENCSAYALPAASQVQFVNAGKCIRNQSPEKVFELPVLSNLSWKKPNFCKPLSKEEFYNFYKIPLDKKIVGFFPDGEHGRETVPASHWMHKNLNKISDYLQNKGYQVICKLHPYEHYGRKLEYYSGALSSIHYKWNTPVIREEHAHELVNYSDFSLSSISCVAYEHYLYNLPNLNVGMHKKDRDFIENGKIDSRYNLNGKTDGYNLFINNGYNSQFIEENNIDITELIFGHVFSFKDFLENTEKCIDEFIDFRKDESVKNYKFYRNHLVLGNSYNSNPSEVAEVLIKICFSEENNK